MKRDKRVLGILFAMIFGFSLVVIGIVLYNIRSLSIIREKNKAEAIANLVKDGLTSHMVGGIMNKRELFLNNAKKSSGANKIWIFRTPKVEELFGKGFDNEAIRDDLDKKAIQSGKTQQRVLDNIINPMLRITIPYKVEFDSKPDCLKCHTNAKVGDILGGISMEFNLLQVRDQSIQTVLNILIITILFAILFLYISDKLLRPYTQVLFYIKEALQYASNGNYKYKIDENSFKKDSKETIKWLNTLLDKLDGVIGAIEKNISLFVADRSKKFSDPLEKSKSTIEDLAAIYKFKRTIEQDISKEAIYHRLIKIFKEQLKVDDLSLYEVDIKNDKRYLIYDDTPEKFCESADTNTSQKCRAYRTKSVVASDDFPDICQACKTAKEYLCIDFTIDEGISLTINIKPDTKDELRENKKAIGYIRNYLEAAKPILQSKILNEILQRSNMIDGLTGLYNRKYLDIFMDQKVKQYSSFAIAMVDIDYFKKVNDTYGHDVGDMVLKGLSDVFKKSVSKEDIVFRFGGEEFLIFMPNIDAALNTAKKVKDNFKNRIFNADGGNFNKTLSIGLSYYKADSDHVWQVIKNADIALYEAKNTGRNKIVEFKNIKDNTKEE